MNWGSLRHLWKETDGLPITYYLNAYGFNKPNKDFFPKIFEGTLANSCHFEHNCLTKNPSRLLEYFSAFMLIEVTMTTELF